MALTFNNTMAAAMLTAFKNHIDGFAGDTALRIYAGTAPATAQDGLSGATLLASFTIRNPCAQTPTGKTLTLNLPADVTASAAGKATFFRIGKLSDTGGTAMLQGAVSDGAGSGELKLNKTDIVQNENVSVVEITFKLP
jgi:hypothetical protein